MRRTTNTSLVLEYNLYIKKTYIYKYLGVPVGDPKRQNMDDILLKTADDFQKIVDSCLSPAQIINAYKTFFHSRLPFAFRTRSLKLYTLSCKHSSQQSDGRPPALGFDQKIRKMIKKKLCCEIYQCTNDLLYTSTQFGGLGIMSSHDDYYVNKIVIFFRSLNSVDPYISSLSRIKLTEAAQRR
jgi:hypothetical protein